MSIKFYIHLLITFEKKNNQVQTFFHESVNKSKKINFWKKIISNNIDKKAIIHKCSKFPANIFKNEKR